MRHALKGNEPAIHLIDSVVFIARIWDNLIDGDKPVSGEDINRMMWMAMVEIPSNAFYVQHKFQIIPLLRDCINCWLDANDFEKSSSADKKEIAFVLRDMIGNIAIQCAYLVGGYEWMRKISPLIRKIQFEESLSDYMGGL